jgi:transposase
VLTLPSSVRVFVARDPVDFRRAHDGLSGVVSNVLEQDPLSGHVFVFVNKRRDRIKLLVWDGTGLWLHYKRLARGTFESITHFDVDAPGIEVDMARLQMLLQGIDLRKSRIRHHFGARRRRRGRRGLAVGRRQDRGPT